MVYLPGVTGKKRGCTLVDWLNDDHYATRNKLSFELQQGHKTVLTCPDMVVHASRKREDKHGRNTT